MNTVSEQRRRDMLRSALGSPISEALKDPAVIEIMVNPDGKLWLDRLGQGCIDTGVVIHPAVFMRSD